MDPSFVFDKIDKIVSKAELGRKKAEYFKNVVNNLLNFEAFDEKSKLALSSSYDDVRAITTDVCNDIKNFDIETLKNFLKEDSKLNVFKSEKEDIELKCNFVLNLEDMKTFQENLDYLSKAFNIKEARFNIINKISSIADKHIDIHVNASRVFNNLKKDIEDSLKRE
ncbi:MAG: hypothetical protein QXW13_00350 [Nanopusillaceae archaeon]